MFGRTMRSRELRAITNSPWGVWPGDESAPTAAGVSVTSANATQLLTVYGCTRLLADAISTLPLDVYRVEKDGTKTDLPVPRLLEEPMPGLDRIAWMTQILTSLLLDGNAYIALHYGATGGLPVELQPIDPAKVRVKRESGRRVYYIDGVPSPRIILHIPGIMRAGSDVGLSPVESARQSIGGGMAVQEFAGRFFGQGATMAGVITVPGSLPPEGPASPREMARAFLRQHSGKNKAHLPAVLQGGAQWQSTGVTNEQAQFLETRGFTAAEIAGQMFLLDPSDLGIPVAGTSLTYANLEQRNTRRLQVALMPWIIRIEHALSALLAKPRYVKLNTNAYLRADLKTRYESYAIGITNEFLVPNEPRGWEDLSPLPDGDAVVAKPTPTPPAPAPDTGA